MKSHCATKWRPTQIDTSQFSDQIRAARRRVDELRRRAQTHAAPAAGMLEKSMTELLTTLEEHRVAEEELRTQNEELVQTREAAETQRQRYQELFEFAPDAYLVTDAEGMIQEANRAAAM